MLTLEKKQTWTKTLDVYKCLLQAAWAVGSRKALALKGIGPHRVLF